MHLNARLLTAKSEMSNFGWETKKWALVLVIRHCPFDFWLFSHLTVVPESSYLTITTIRTVTVGSIWPFRLQKVLPCCYSITYWLINPLQVNVLLKFSVSLSLSFSLTGSPWVQLEMKNQFTERTHPIIACVRQIDQPKTPMSFVVGLAVDLTVCLTISLGTVAHIMEINQTNCL